MIEILTTLLVIITGVYAYLTFRILEANRGSVAAMKTQVEAATRPYVIVALAPERSGFTVFVFRTWVTPPPRTCGFKAPPRSSR